MRAEQEQLDRKQERLVEIYKLQAQLANSISNRRTTTNRFYILIMSGLALIFSTFLQNKDKLPIELLKIISIENLIVALGVLGLSLSWIWCFSINSYLRVNSRKYEALKKLEDELEYKFFKNEWEFLGDDEKTNTYWQRSVIELTVPGLFFLCFTALMGFGLYNLANKLYLLFLIYPIFLAGLLCFGLHKWHKIEKSFNKGDQKNDKMDR